MSGGEIPPRVAELLRLMAACNGDGGAYLEVGGRTNDPDRAVLYCAAVERAAVGREAEALIRREGVEAALKTARAKAAHFQRLRPLDGFAWWRDVRLRAWREIAEALQSDLAGAALAAPAVAV